MSYDIALLPRQGGEDLQAAIDRLRLDEEIEVDADLVDRWRDIERNARKIVRGIRTTTIEPGCRELADDRTGITVSAEHYVTLSIPYWYDGEQRLEMLGTLLQLAEQLEADTGLAAHDLQVKRWLSDGIAPEDAAAAYQHGRDISAEPQAVDAQRLGHGIIRFFSWNLQHRRRKK